MNETTPSLFQEVKLADLSFNPFTLIDKEWMLIASGDSQVHNAMTASWGGLGVLWKTYVSFIFVRPQRFSMQFLEKSPTYPFAFSIRSTVLPWHTLVPIPARMWIKMRKRA